MKFLLRSLIFLFSIIFFLSINGCVSKKNISEIQFGQGGGFTGKVKTYQLTSDGVIQEIKDGKAETIRKIKKKKTKKIFVTANKIKTYQFNEPSNFYSFIEIQSKEGNNKIVWSIGSTKIDKNATALYNELMQLIQQQP